MGRSSRPSPPQVPLPLSAKMLFRYFHRRRRSNFAAAIREALLVDDCYETLSMGERRLLDGVAASTDNSTASIVVADILMRIIAADYLEFKWKQLAAEYEEAFRAVTVVSAPYYLRSNARVTAAELCHSQKSYDVVAAKIRIFPQYQGFVAEWRRFKERHPEAITALRSLRHLQPVIGELEQRSTRPPREKSTLDHCSELLKTVREAVEGLETGGSAAEAERQPLIRLERAHGLGLVPAALAA